MRPRMPPRPAQSTPVSLVTVRCRPHREQRRLEKRRLHSWRRALRHRRERREWWSFRPDRVPARRALEAQPRAQGAPLARGEPEAWSRSDVESQPDWPQLGGRLPSVLPPGSQLSPPPPLPRPFGGQWSARVFPGSCPLPCDPQCIGEWENWKIGEWRWRSRASESRHAQFAKWPTGQFTNCPISRHYPIALSASSAAWRTLRLRS